MIGDYGGGRPIRAKTYVSVLHAMSLGGAGGVDTPECCGRRQRPLRVLRAMSSPALAPRFVACNTTRQTRKLRAMSMHAMIARNEQAVHTAIRSEI
jgi:hypothetical protein